jgi:hypothetical protein
MTDETPATGRYLIYSMAFGQEFRRYATMLVRSIREIGRWPHDIVLLSDSPKPLPECEDITVVDIAESLAVRYPGLRLGARALRQMKGQLEYHVDLSRYDYVLYLDSDVLVTNDRLRDLVPQLCREQAIVVLQDIIAVETRAPVTGAQILTIEEQDLWSAYAINAGVVGLPMTPMGRRLLRDWRALNVAQRFKLRDQGNLISLLLRKYYGQWGFLSDAVIGRELTPYWQTFVHFTTRKETLMEAYYKDILGLSPPTGSPDARSA